MATKRISVVIVIAMISTFVLKARGTTTRWTPLGCYKEKPEDRALKSFLGYVHATTINPRLIFQKCRQKAKYRNMTYFGIQNSNECWGSNAGNTTYDKHGCANNCILSSNRKHGIGPERWMSFVYYNMPVWSACDCSNNMQYKLDLIKDKRPFCPLYNQKVSYRTPHKTQKCTGHKRNGGWSKFAPWSACDQLCGHNGKQRRTRTCTNPEPADCGKDCVGPAEEIIDCNAKNCPKPCSFDGIMVQLLNTLGIKTSKNNYVISAFSQVIDAMNRNGNKAEASTDDILIEKIGDLLNDKTNAKDKHARTLLGVLLAQQKDCNYKKVAKELKDNIGVEAFKRLINVEGKVTLTFVMDISGGMKHAVKKSTEIAKVIAGYEYNSNVDYVLSTFSEDTTRNVQIFDNVNKFFDALDNLSNREYRADREQTVKCYAITYAGIIKAITQGHPRQGSPMYVFTNASPKPLGGYTEDNAIYQASKNNIPVNIFVYKSNDGLCSGQRGPFRTIAKATGGFRRPFKSSSSVKTIQRALEGNIKGTCSIASDSRKRKRTTGKKHFVIDDIAEEGTIEVLDEGGRGDLYTPNNELINAEENHGNRRLWTILRPLRGTWTFRSDVGKFEVNSHSSLDIRFDYKFMRGNLLLDHPLKGEKAKVRIKVPNISRLNKSSVSFFDEQSEWSLEKPIKENTFYYKSKSNMRNDFMITMSGKTLSGFKFTRQSVVIQPKITAIRSRIGWFFPKPNTKFLYKASIITGQMYGWEVSEMRKFRMKIEIVSDGDDDDDGDNGFEDITLKKDDEKHISKTLQAPSSGEFTVQITIKNTGRNNDAVEINFEDGPFSVEDD